MKKSLSQFFKILAMICLFAIIGYVNWYDYSVSAWIVGVIAMIVICGPLVWISCMLDSEA